MVGGTANGSFFAGGPSTTPPPGAPAFTSAASDTVPSGTAFTYSVTTTGTPTPAITLDTVSTLPSGVTLTDNGNGTATLAGTSAVAPGVYTFSIGASNGISPNATQAFTLTVTSAPAITSAASDTVPSGSAFTYSVTTTGSPTPAITLASGSTLPSGVTLTDNGNGTATLAGTSAVAPGVYTFFIGAANGVTPNATQAFTLTVTSAPAITSAASDTVAAGTAFAYSVTTTGTPTPAITLNTVSTLPSGVTLTDNKNGTATLAGTSSVAPGVYTFSIGASNGITPNATQAFTLTVTSAPAITSAASDTVPSGSAFTYSVTTTGTPTPAITLASGSTLPSGVTLTDNKNGTATLAGTSAVAAGVYTFSIQAANGITPNATQAFTLTVTKAPAFTSAASDTVPAGTAFTYSVTTTGTPTPTITLASGSTLPERGDADGQRERDGHLGRHLGGDGRDLHLQHPGGERDHPQRHPGLHADGDAGDEGPGHHQRRQ